jgi:hypothetical protein
VVCRITCLGGSVELVRACVFECIRSVTNKLRTLWRLCCCDKKSFIYDLRSGLVKKPEKVLARFDRASSSEGRFVPNRRVA